MFCPDCNQHYDSGKFCPECGTTLVDDAPASSGAAFGVGDYAAIEGGIHLSDSHNVHHEDRSVHNITNTTSTVNNITQVSAKKTAHELLQEHKTAYLTACKRAYEDNVLEQHEVVELEELRIKLSLDKETANSILEEVRVMSERNARKTVLNPIARTKLKILTENLKKNEVKALMDQIDSLEPLVRKFDHDELSRKYFLVLAALKSERCIELYETSMVDSYWKSFWSYLAYIKQGQLSKADDVLVSLDRFSGYPEDNINVLAVAGALMMGNMVDAKEYLNEIIGEYTPALQRFVDSIYLLLEPDVAKEMGADELSCAFYLVNFFGQIDPKEKLSGLQRWGEDAQNGNPEAQYRLGMCYSEGEKEKKDVRLAFEWFMKAAEQGHAEAQCKVSECYLTGEGVEEDKSQAIEWCRKSAEQGCAEAQATLGLCYWNGIIVPEDESKAIEWLRKAAEQGYAEAQCELGNCFSNFLSEYEDESQAFEWYRKAAEQDHAEAIYKLGICYRNGEGVEKDMNQAMALFNKAAEKGEIKALDMLAHIYRYGDDDGIEKDIKNAADYLLKISKVANEEKILEEFESDYYDQIFDLGKKFLYLKDTYIAVDLLKIVANVKDLSWEGLEEKRDEAQRLLQAQDLYEKGGEKFSLHIFSDNIFPSEKEKAEGVEIYKKAAELGHVKALFELGEFYEDGECGLDENLETALSLYNKAADQEYLLAKNKLMKIYSRRYVGSNLFDKTPNPYFNLSKAYDMAMWILDNADYQTIKEEIDRGWYYDAYVLGKQIWNMESVDEFEYHKAGAAVLLRKVANIELENDTLSSNDKARDEARKFLVSHGYHL